MLERNHKVLSSVDVRVQLTLEKYYQSLGPSAGFFSASEQVAEDKVAGNVKTSWWKDRAERRKGTLMG